MYLIILFFFYAQKFFLPFTIIAMFVHIFSHSYMVNFSFFIFLRHLQFILMDDLRFRTTKLCSSKKIAIIPS